MCTILHISDLHFGKELAPPIDKLLTTKDGAINLGKEIAELVANARPEYFDKPDCIVITGDISNSADRAEFDHAKIFINTLLKSIKISKNSLLIVPGNHDIKWGLPGARPNREKYAEYKRFFESLFPKKEWEPEKPQYVTLMKNKTICKTILFGFNSCSVENKAWSGLGYINEKQLNFIEKMLKQKKYDKSLRIAALHHHVLPVFNYHPSFKDYDPNMSPDKMNKRPPVSLLMNASQFLKRCRMHDVTAILHGHAHSPFSVNQTNYLDIDGHREEVISKSIAVIGAGSPTVVKPNNYRLGHFEIINIVNNNKEPLIYVWPFKDTDASTRQVGSMQLKTKAIVLHGGKQIVNTTQHVLAKLRNSLNEALIKGSKLGAADSEESDEIKSDYDIYNAILKKTMEWLSDQTGATWGKAVIARYVKDLGVYKHIAIFNYSNKIKNIAYNLDEKGKSITIEAAITNKTIIVPNRSNSLIASKARSELYDKEFDVKDQTCLAVPLNSTNKKYAYAVLGIARNTVDPTHEFSLQNAVLLENIAETIEMALRQAELAHIGYQRAKLLRLFKYLQEYLGKNPNSSILDDLMKIGNSIYDAFSLGDNEDNALAIHLPQKPKFKNTYVVAEKGFGTARAEEMKYKIGVPEGLTGTIINTREPDYCFDHLSDNKLSYRNVISSKKCLKSPKPMVDHLLSFVGVPLGGHNKLANYNKGALILNLPIPLGHGMASSAEKQRGEYIQNLYIEPMMIISQLLEPLIETKWKKYCFSKIVK